MHQAAAQAAARQSHVPGTLYVVATPIGNLADVSLRAVYVLGRVDVVACEDTRVGAQLLRHLGLHKPLLALHAHNEQQASVPIIDRLKTGESVAYISDAGTPAISDPGAVLVAAAAAAGHKVVPVPGASSALAALSVAGVLGHGADEARGGGFCFVGFLPAKGGPRRSALAAVLADPRTQVLFEAPHRIQALADELAQGAAQRVLTLCRELTKQFETVVTQPAAALPAWLAADSQRLRGEFVLVLHPVPVSTPADDELPADALRTLQLLLRELPLKQAVALAAELTQAPRNLLYQQALQWRDTDLPAP